MKSDVPAVVVCATPWSKSACIYYYNYNGKVRSKHIEYAKTDLVPRLERTDPIGINTTSLRTLLNYGHLTLPRIKIGTTRIPFDKCTLMSNACIIHNGCSQTLCAVAKENADSWATNIMRLADDHRITNLLFSHRWSDHMCVCRARKTTPYSATSNFQF